MVDEAHQVVSRESATDRFLPLYEVLVAFEFDEVGDDKS